MTNEIRLSIIRTTLKEWKVSSYREEMYSLDVSWLLGLVDKLHEEIRDLEEAIEEMHA